MKLFTLIHICENEQSLHNSSTQNFDEQIKLYFTCAKRLHFSLAHEQVELCILTNNKVYLQQFNSEHYNIEIVELNFKLNVPSGVKFYSAHYKLELFQYLSSLQCDYVGVIDSDVLCVNKMPQSLKNVIELRIPLYYDITEQMAPAFGSDVIIADKEKLMPQKSVGLWAGGEFISGPPSFFYFLFQEVKKVLEKYFSDFRSFYHQGDEMITSVAIEILLQKNTTIFDAGALSVIGRFWSANTLHFQKSFKSYGQHFLVHLPADKNFISALHKDESKKVFFKKYKKYLFKKGFIKVAGRILSALKK